jgi:hypothetical protein
MGGGGSYYDRDVTPRSSYGGPSTTAQREMQQSSLHPDMSAKGRRMTCNARSPLVYAFDVTGSMGKMPQIIYDKMPMIVGQIIAREYLEEFQMCFAAVGDHNHDRVPVQVGSFGSPREADAWLKKIYIESGGGSNNVESYELIAYYFAFMADFPNAVHPFFLFTGDEGMYETISAATIRNHIDPTYTGQDVSTAEVFARLLEKFRGNVFCIRKHYAHGEAKALRSWVNVLGEDRVIALPTSDELSIGDVTLGLFAIASGARTLDQYIEDMSTRPLDLASNVEFKPQTPQRIAAVREALAPMLNFRSQTGVASGRLGLLMDRG